jgi:hypothetical protein
MLSVTYKLVMLSVVMLSVMVPPLYLTTPRFKLQQQKCFMTLAPHAQDAPQTAAGVDGHLRHPYLGLML